MKPFLALAFFLAPLAPASAAVAQDGCPAAKCTQSTATATPVAQKESCPLAAQTAAQTAQQPCAKSKQAAGAQAAKVSGRWVSESSCSATATAVAASQKSACATAVASGPLATQCESKAAATQVASISCNKTLPASYQQCDWSSAVAGKACEKSTATTVAASSCQDAAKVADCAKSQQASTVAWVAPACTTAQACEKVQEATSVSFNAPGCCKTQQATLSAAPQCEQAKTCEQTQATTIAQSVTCAQGEQCCKTQQATLSAAPQCEQAKTCEQTQATTVAQSVTCAQGEQCCKTQQATTTAAFKVADCAAAASCTTKAVGASAPVVFQVQCPQAAGSCSQSQQVSALVVPSCEKAQQATQVLTKVVTCEQGSQDCCKAGAVSLSGGSGPAKAFVVRVKADGGCEQIQEVALQDLAGVASGQVWVTAGGETACIAVPGECATGAGATVQKVQLQGHCDVLGALGGTAVQPMVARLARVADAPAGETAAAAKLAALEARLARLEAQLNRIESALERMSQR